MGHRISNSSRSSQVHNLPVVYLAVVAVLACLAKPSNNRLSSSKVAEVSIIIEVSYTWCSSLSSLRCAEHPATKYRPIRWEHYWQWSVRQHPATSTRCSTTAEHVHQYPRYQTGCSGYSAHWWSVRRRVRDKYHSDTAEPAHSRWSLWVNVGPASTESANVECVRGRDIRQTSRSYARCYYVNRSTTGRLRIVDFWR